MHASEPTVPLNESTSVVSTESVVVPPSCACKTAVWEGARRGLLCVSLRSLKVLLSIGPWFLMAMWAGWAYVGLKGDTSRVLKMQDKDRKTLSRATVWTGSGPGRSVQDSCPTVTRTPVGRQSTLPTSSSLTWPVDGPSQLPVSRAPGRSAILCLSRGTNKLRWKREISYWLNQIQRIYYLIFHFWGT